MDTPEARLARYWRTKTGLAWSDFDIFQKKTPPAGTAVRGTPPEMYARNMDFTAVMEDITRLIWHGWPLSRSEYYLAVAFNLLLGDYPYEKFYQYHWHEDATHRGYGSCK